MERGLVGLRAFCQIVSKAVNLPAFLRFDWEYIDERPMALKD